MRLWDALLKPRLLEGKDWRSWSSEDQVQVKQIEEYAVCVVDSRSECTCKSWAIATTNAVGRSRSITRVVLHLLFKHVDFVCCMPLPCTTGTHDLRLLFYYSPHTSTVRTLLLRPLAQHDACIPSATSGTLHAQKNTARQHAHSHPAQHHAEACNSMTSTFATKDSR